MMMMFMQLVLFCAHACLIFADINYNFDPEDCEIDLAFLMDSSGSIYTHEFKAQKEFAKAVVTHLKESDVNVAAVSVANKENPHFFLDSYDTEADTLTGIDNITKSGGYTNLHLGLDFLRTTVFTEEYGDRHEVPDVVIVLTDGFSNNQEQKAKDAAQALYGPGGVTVIAIGVGKDADKDVLKYIASDDDFIWLEDWDKLKDKLDWVLQSICNRCDRHGEGWIKRPDSESCYLFVQKDRTCRKAKEYCKDASKYLNSHGHNHIYPMLVRIETEEENKWVHDQMENVYKGGNRWIGMTIRHGWKPSPYWNDCPKDYAHWTKFKPNEPNDHKDKNETCVQIIKKGPWKSYWNDVVPRKTVEFVCEVPRVYTKNCTGTEEQPGPNDHKQHYHLVDVCLLNDFSEKCFWKWNILYFLRGEHHMKCLAPCSGHFRLYIK